MSWTEERIATALGLLDAPAADEAFWERLRIDLLTSDPYMNEDAIVTFNSDHQMAKVLPLVRSSRRVRWYMAVTGAAALLIVGLYVIGRAPDQTPGDSPARTDLVLTDPLSLTLDDQPRTAAPPVPLSEYLILDVAHLPPGWTATMNTSFGIIWPPDNGYRVMYSLLSPTGDSYGIDLFAAFSMKPESGTPVVINGHDGLQRTRKEVWWEQQPGIEVTVSDLSNDSSPIAATDLIDVSRALVFESAEELPILPIDPHAEPSRFGAQFAGTLNGIPYTVSTNAGPLRGMRVSVGDKGVAGVEEDRLSQPTDDPMTEGTVSIDGITGYGAIAFGYTEPATAALRANLANGSTIQVPVLRNPGETYFALPIPLGVDVTTLDFLDISGAILRTATMPSLPAYFGHCCSSAPWTTDTAPTSS